MRKPGSRCGPSTLPSTVATLAEATLALTSASEETAVARAPAATLATEHAAAAALLRSREVGPDALHGLDDHPLHAGEAVLLVGLIRVVGRPRRRPRRGAAVAPDALGRCGVGAGRLQNLEAPGHAQVALAEGAGRLDVEALDEPLPAAGGHGGHALDDDLAAVQPREAQHVLVGGPVRAVQLRHQEVDQEDQDHNDVDGHGCQQQGVMAHEQEGLAAVHAQGNLQQVQGRERDVGEVRVVLLQGTHRAAEGRREENETEDEEADLGEHAEADEREGRDAR
mmetsp:Transcript_78240/g.201444  ORF Transcript_78240/g.201444 Transcript_78240/m.201444 type:complete len:281 (-) Transcript_78240:676-1518(-)